jgi:hypothetical protein
MAGPEAEQRRALFELRTPRRRSSFPREMRWVDRMGGWFRAFVGTGTRVAVGAMQDHGHRTLLARRANPGAAMRQPAPRTGEWNMFKGKRLTLWLGVSVLLVSAVAAAYSPQWSAPFMLTSVEVDDAGSGSATFLGFSTLPATPPPCGTGALQFMATGSADQVKAVTAMATSAFLAGRQVKVYFDGNCSTGSVACTTAGASCYAKFKAFTLQ